MDRRRHTRHERYFPVRFGDGEGEYQARTRDLSSGGLFVATRDALPPGARLWLEVALEPQRPLYFEGVVVRQLDALPVRQREGGFAVRFVSAAEALADFLGPPPGAEVAAPVPVTFASREALDRAARAGLFAGYVFLWSADARRVGDRLRLALSAPFAARS